jgi:hypothetical protein
VSAPHVAGRQCAPATVAARGDERAASVHARRGWFSSLGGWRARQPRLSTAETRRLRTTLADGEWPALLARSSSAFRGLEMSQPGGRAIVLATRKRILQPDHRMRRAD